MVTNEYTFLVYNDCTFFSINPVLKKVYGREKDIFHSINFQ